MEDIIKINGTEYQQLKYMALIALLLTQSRDFDSMVAEVMIKMGRVKEALKAMFEAKLNNQ